MKPSVEDRIDRIIQDENIENSIERIQGYLEQYNWNQNVLNKLAELHLKNGNEILAGKYWFFKEDKNEIEKKAVNTFRNSLGNDLKLIVRQLIGHVDKSPKNLNQFTKVELLKLLIEIKETDGDIPIFAQNWYLHLIKENKNNR